MTDNSPLAEADPASLEELFSRDPLKLSDLDIDRIIEAERAQRAKLALAPEKEPRKRADARTEISADDIVF